MIYFSQVTFGYNSKNDVFRNLSLTLNPGSVYGLLGRNGAGKSSLLRLMAGLLIPVKGTITVDGFEPRHRQPAFLEDLFFIPEEIYLPSVSLERLIKNLAPFYPKFDEEVFRKHLVAFDVPAGQNITAMSYGQKKKLLISFGIATNTRLLIMDEPTNGLDIPSKSQFRKVVSSALESDRTILVSTHQVRDLDNLIDSLIILDESEILLNHPLDVVARHLHFTTLSEVETDNRILYAEPSLRGYSVVMENDEGEDSKIDLERLFNAVVKNRERVKTLFNPATPQL